MPKPPVVTRRLDRDVVLATVTWNDWADYKARAGLRTVGGYWPSHSDKPIVFVEPVTLFDPKEIKP